MEAALTLAKRGFETTLFEASEKLGGTVNLAAIPPHKGMLLEFVETMEAQLEAAGVHVQKGVAATPEMVKATGAEAVFLAAGGKVILVGDSSRPGQFVCKYPGCCSLFPQNGFPHS